MLGILIRCLLAAPVPPQAPDSSDDDGDRTWTADDLQDFEDQQSPPPSPMQHYPAPRDPLVRFLADVPDWSVLDQAALQNAIGQLPVPLPGPGPPGLSLKDAVEVRTPDHPLYLRHRMQYRIRYIYSCNIVYDIV